LHTPGISPPKKTTKVFSPSVHQQKYINIYIYIPIPPHHILTHFDFSLLTILPKAMRKTASERKGTPSRLRKLRDIDRGTPTEDPIVESDSESELLRSLIKDDLIEGSDSESDKRDDKKGGDEEEDAIEDYEEEMGKVETDPIGSDGEEKGDIQMSRLMPKYDSEEEIDDAEEEKEEKDECRQFDGVLCKWDDEQDDEEEEEEASEKEKVDFFKNIGALVQTASLSSPKPKEKKKRSPTTKSKKMNEKEQVEEEKSVRRKRKQTTKVSPKVLPTVISDDDASESCVSNPLLAAYLKKCFDDEAILDSEDESGDVDDKVGIDCDGEDDDEDDESEEDGEDDEDETLDGFVVNDLDEIERDDERSPSSKARRAFLLEDDRDMGAMSKEMVIYEDKIRAFVGDYKFIIGLSGVTDTGVAERNLQPHLGKLCNDPLYSQYQKLQTLHGLLLKDLLKLWRCYDNFRTQQDITRRIIKRSLPSDDEEEMDAVLEGLISSQRNGRKRSNIIKD
jgi:hypothetical protein